tara:strand:- start:12535 stop:12915 length:381 start_codon:yes stop_codon:yes gene_type:complete
MQKINLYFRLFVFLLMAAIYASPAQAKWIKEFRDSTAQSCFDTQKSSPLNKELPKKVVKIYCLCWAYEITENISLDDIAQINKIILSSEHSQEQDNKMLALLLKGRNIVSVTNKCAEMAIDINKLD